MRAFNFWTSLSLAVTLTGMAAARPTRRSLLGDVGVLGPPPASVGNVTGALPVFLAGDDGKSSQLEIPFTGNAWFSHFPHKNRTYLYSCINVDETEGNIDGRLWVSKIGKQELTNSEGGTDSGINAVTLFDQKNCQAGEASWSTCLTDMRDFWDDDVEEVNCKSEHDDVIEANGLTEVTGDESHTYPAKSIMVLGPETGEGTGTWNSVVDFSGKAVCVGLSAMCGLGCAVGNAVAGNPPPEPCF